MKKEEDKFKVEEEDIQGVGISKEAELETKAILLEEEKKKLKEVTLQIYGILHEIKNNTNKLVDDAIKRLDMLKEKI